MILERNNGKQWVYVIFLMAFLLLPVAVHGIDTDNDGLSDDQEALYYTNPKSADTDGDGFLDGIEVASGYSPTMVSSTKMHESDFDKDGLNDWLEIWFRSDLNKSDTDGDGKTDFDEVMSANSPTDPKNTKKFARWIEVDRTSQRLNYYVDKVKILNLPTSTGNPHSPTPAGNFTVQKKIENKRYVGVGYDLPNVMWNLQFKPGYYIHTAYWHNDFGKRTHSHGCVNLLEKDAALLYTYVDVGVPVKIIGETPKKFVVGT